MVWLTPYTRSAAAVFTEQRVNRTRISDAPLGILPQGLGVADTRNMARAATSTCCADPGFAYWEIRGTNLKAPSSEGAFVVMRHS